MIHLFLSPHFDDAVGSCGGVLWRLAKLAYPVQVLTAFGGLESEQLSMPAKVLHEEWKLERPVVQRRREDTSACRLLGCDSSFLDFPDAIYRLTTNGRHLYPTFESLRGAVAFEDQTLPEQLARSVKAQISQDTLVYCPMAIGGHVDHIIARTCGKILEESDVRVAYYRDFYYDRAWPSDVDHALLSHINVTLTTQELEKKIIAFSEYKSQLSNLFLDQTGMVRYFGEIGRNESIFLPQPTNGPLLEMLLNALKGEAAGHTPAS
jgi:LmbE family N-acetylglucosaminyl deacetylase